MELAEKIPAWETVENLEAAVSALYASSMPGWEAFEKRGSSYSQPMPPRLSRLGGIWETQGYDVARVVNVLLE